MSAGFEDIEMVLLYKEGSQKQSHIRNLREKSGNLSGVDAL